MRRPFRRPVLLLVPALVVSALIGDVAFAQRGFQPGGPRPGGPGRPPNPGGVPMPQPPRIPGVGVPQQPAVVPPFQPPFQPKGVPQFERVWTCSNCGRELARGGGTPAVATCPFCNVRFVNGTQPNAPGGNVRGPVGALIVPGGPPAPVGLQPNGIAPVAAGGWKERPVLESATFRGTVAGGAAVWGGLALLGVVLKLAGRSRGETESVPE